MNSRNYRQKITKESEILLFGKFKHKTIQHILRNEPSYILWLQEEKIVKFPEEILEKALDLHEERNPFDDWEDYAEVHYGDRD